MHDPREAEKKAERLGRETAEAGYTAIISFRIENGRRRFDIFRQHDGEKIVTLSTGGYLGAFFDAYGIEKERAALKAAETAPGFDRHRQALNAKQGAEK